MATVGVKGLSITYMYIYYPLECCTWVYISQNLLIRWPWRSACYWSHGLGYE